jgi:hypothetical protein
MGVADDVMWAWSLPLRLRNKMTSYDVIGCVTSVTSMSQQDEVIIDVTTA